MSHAETLGICGVGHKARKVLMLPFDATGVRLPCAYDVGLGLK